MLLKIIWTEITLPYVRLKQVHFNSLKISRPMAKILHLWDLYKRIEKK